jgi:hypothetical protein
VDEFRRLADDFLSQHMRPNASQISSGRQGCSRTGRAAKVRSPSDEKKNVGPLPRSDATILETLAGIKGHQARCIAKRFQGRLMMMHELAGDQEDRYGNYSRNQVESAHSLRPNLATIITRLSAWVSCLFI